MKITGIVLNDSEVHYLFPNSESLQNLQDPLHQQEIMATQVPTQALLYVPPYNLTLGKKHLVIMDKNSYENNW